MQRSAGRARLCVVVALMAVWSALASAPVEAVAAPSVSVVSPNRGPSAGGSSVTITGTGFTGATRVRFGPTATAAFVVVSDTRIQATAPPGPDATLVNVWVESPAGTSAPGPRTTYYYVDPPTVTGVAPHSGPLMGGTTVTITGSGFRGATAVRFNRTTDWIDVTAPAFSVDSDTQITVTTPPSAEESGEVQVIEGFQLSPRARGAVFAWVEPLPAYAGAPGAPNLAVLGDSIVEIASSTLLDVLGADHQVSLKGLGGYRTDELQPYADLLAAGPVLPQRAVVEVGSNDAIEHHLVGLGDNSYPPIDVEESADRLEDLVATLPAPTTCVVLVTVNRTVTPDPGPAQVLNDRMQALATAGAGRIQIADWDASVQEHAARAGEPGWKTWLPDGIHPNLAGAAELARLIDEALDRCTPTVATVASVSPPAGPSHGGQQVVLTGSGFTGATRVRFGPTAAATIVSVTDNRLVVTSPDITGPALVHVRVDNPRGTSATHTGTLYYVRP